MTRDQAEREIDDLEIVWSKWRASGPIWTQFGPSDQRSAKLAKLFAEHALLRERMRAGEQAARIRELEGLLEYGTTGDPKVLRPAPPVKGGK